MSTLILTLFALLGVPLFAMFGAGTLYLKSGDDHFQQMGILLDFHKMTRHDVLVAIPLFTLVGYMLANSGSPARIIRFVRAWLGWMNGGLAIVAIICCAFITVFTGASGVTIIALGGLLVPMLIKDGYSEKFSIGLITCGGSLGLLFYPALPLILLSMVGSGISKDLLLDHLALAGILPGLLIMLMLSVYSWWVARDQVVPKQTFNWTEARIATLKASGELMIPMIILGGIYGSWFFLGRALFAPTEVAGIIAFYVFVLEVVIYREIHVLRDLPKIIRESMMLVGGILIILGITQAMTNYITLEGIPDKLVVILRGYVSSPLMFLLLLNIFLLVVGCLMDIFSAIVVVFPMILPVAISYDIHPIHLAVIFLANLEIGYLTPPIGLNLFISSFCFKKKVIELYRIAVPYQIILLTALFIITYWPWLSLASLK